MLTIRALSLELVDPAFAFPVSALENGVAARITMFRGLSSVDTDCEKCYEEAYEDRHTVCFFMCLYED